MRASPGGLGAVKTGANYAASLVAAARAKETASPDPLISDPYAAILVAGAGTLI